MTLKLFAADKVNCGGTAVVSPTSDVITSPGFLNKAKQKKQLTYKYIIIHTGLFSGRYAYAACSHPRETKLFNFSANSHYSLVFENMR